MSPPVTIKAYCSEYLLKYAPSPKLSFSDIVVNSEKEMRICSPRNEQTLFWRSYQETWPNEHFLGKPEQTKDLHLF